VDIMRELEHVLNSKLGCLNNYFDVKLMNIRSKVPCVVCRGCRLPLFSHNFCIR
jgi:hypothetical protein